MHSAGGHDITRGHSPTDSDGRIYLFTPRRIVLSFVSSQCFPLFIGPCGVSYLNKRWKILHGLCRLFHPSLISRFDVYIESESIRNIRKKRTEKTELDISRRLLLGPFLNIFPILWILSKTSTHLFCLYLSSSSFFIMRKHSFQVHSSLSLRWSRQHFPIIKRHITVRFVENCSSSLNESCKLNAKNESNRSEIHLI